VCPKVDQRAGQLSLPHLGITKTEKIELKHKTDEQISPVNGLEPRDQSDRQKQTKVVEDKIFLNGRFWAQSETVSLFWLYANQPTTSLTWTFSFSSIRCDRISCTSPQMITAIQTLSIIHSNFTRASETNVNEMSLGDSVDSSICTEHIRRELRRPTF